MRLVCAVMPTRGRSRLAALALQSYLSQKYENKRLYILDDASDPSFPDWRYVATVDYRQHYRSMNIPEKRNVLTGLAPKDSVIMHFDSDDWSAPDRMSSQMHLMDESQSPFVAFHSVLFYEEQTGRAYKYEGTPRFVAVGTSFCFTREWGFKHPFPEQPTKRNPLALATDNAVAEMARQEQCLLTVDGGQLIVARVHPGNSSPKATSRAEYKPVPLDALPADFIP